jgi:hypothetical protein
MTQLTPWTRSACGLAPCAATASRSGSALTRTALTIQTLVAVAVIAIGATLFATALQGIARTNTRLAAAATQTTPDRTSSPCPHLAACDEV